MDGADTGATGGPTTPGGPGDTGGRDDIGNISSQFYFLKAFSRALVVLTIQSPMLWPCHQNHACDPK